MGIGDGITPDQDYVLETIKNRDVHFLRCWFTDVLGNLRSFAVVPSEIERAFREGMRFDGRGISGFSGAGEGGILVYPDASTFQVLPWRPESNAVARMFCDIRTFDGEPLATDPRHILDRTLKRLSDAGYTASIGVAMQHFYFVDGSGTEVLDEGSCFDLTTLDHASDLRRDTVLTLESMGIPVEYSHHAGAPSQHEIVLRPDDAMAIADAIMTYKLVVKEIASKHGVHATFMPKPMTDAPGSGMRLQLSIFDEGGEDALFDADDASGHLLSDTAKGLIAGILYHAGETSLVTNQYVNSYKRLASGMGAPDIVGWSVNGEHTILRVPTYKEQSPDPRRIEIANPDPAANPYLAIAALISSGLDGIERGMDPSASLPSKNIEADSEGASADDVQRLPGTLIDAVNSFEESDLMQDVLGEDAHSYLSDAKSEEWMAFHQTVTQWEIDHCLGVL